MMSNDLFIIPDEFFDETLPQKTKWFEIEELTWITNLN